jgi:hypothetical protein
MQKESELKFPITFKLDEENNKIYVYSDKMHYIVNTKPFSYKCEAGKDVKNIESSDNIMEEDDKFIYFVHEPQRKKSKSFFGYVANKILGSEDRYMIMIDKQTGSLFSGYIDDKGIFDHDIEIFYKQINKDNKEYIHSTKYLKSCNNEKKYFLEITKKDIELMGDGKLYGFQDTYIYYHNSHLKHYQGNALLKYEDNYNTKFPYPTVSCGSAKHGYTIDTKNSKIFYQGKEFKGEIKCIMHPDFENAYEELKQTQNNFNNNKRKGDKTYDNIYNEDKHQECEGVPFIRKDKYRLSDRSL